MFDKLIGAGILAFCLVAGGCVYVPSVDPGVTPSDITWTVQETGAEFADGNTGGMPVKSSDGIQITFSAEVDDLAISDIEITFAGAPVTAELSGSGTIWTALFTVTATNYASVKINRTGIKSGPQNVMVYLKDTLPPLIDDNTVLYVDFDDGTFQGVEASGDTTRATVTAAQFHSAPYSYFITGRAANSNGASWNQGAYLLPGKTYTFSVWFYHEQAASQNMQLFVNYNQGSGFAATGGTRVAVANKSVPRGTWTQVSGNLTPPADCVVTRMIIQNNTSLCDFYIDDIKIELKSGTPESAAIQESLLGIKDAPLFNSKNLLIGAGIGNTVLQDPHGNRQALAAKHFNSIAISNSFKPQYILDYPASVGNLALYNDHAAVYFDITKDYFNFAVTNNMKMSAQALLWYQLTPEWFFHVNYNTAQPLADRDLMLKRMENYIKDVLTWCQTNYPGMFKMWVVCNESIDPTTAVDTATTNPYQVRNDNWYKTVGPDYIAQAFAFAQKYKTDTDLDLVYNDYNLESSGTAASSKFNQVLNYINYYDVQLDGIAFQMHVQLAANSPAVATIKTNIEKIKNDSRVSAKNLSAYISEMDVKADSNDAATMQSLSDRYNTIISTVLGADTRLKGITWWCLTDGYSWLTPNAGKAMYPLMFDINNQAKPAYYGVMQAGGASVSP